ncbi:MAG: tetratricopeptide repeat protein [Lachnospiraceae bacterium]|nr:tetratricopeptide repeat protein [Lachnospiraceae bacterium]
MESGENKKKWLLAIVVVIALIVLFLGFQIITQQIQLNNGIDYLEEKDYEKAYTAFHNAEGKYTIFTSKKNIQYYEGESLIYLGRFDEAAKLYQKIIDKHKDARAYAMKGFAYQQNGDKENAQKAYQTAIEVDEKDGIGYYYLYGYYVEQKEYEKALSVLDDAEAATVTSMEQEIAYAKIVAYEKLLQYDKALNAAKEYCKQYPDDKTGKQEKEFLETR